MAPVPAPRLLWCVAALIPAAALIAIGTVFVLRSERPRTVDVDALTD